MKIGDKVVCKAFPICWNGIIRSNDTNIIIGKTYTVTGTSCQQISNELEMLTIIGENGKCSYWSDYFYSVKELRQIKLKKINEKRD